MYTRRRRRYFVLMGGCIVLFVSAWAFVRLWSVPVAIGMCVVAMVIPPVAAMIANARGPDDRWWDDPPDDPPGDRSGDRSGDPKSDEWWDELDGRKKPPPK
ncbi:DUF3099 domain-containing protein [Streptomyces sp. NBC_01511]|uniref:DUF3099 domain-containing protein n=1 Tax=Streptomyces sp. NBC_01511 TaxID=2903889 RepID=UPI00386376D4